MTNLFDSLKVLTIHQMMEEPLFIGWTTKPTPGEMQAMEGFLMEHVHLKKDVEMARTILLAAKKDSLAVPTEQEKEADFTLLMQRLSAPAVSAQNIKALENQKPLSKKATVRSLWPRLAVAASFLLLIVYIFLLLSPGQQEMYATGPGEILDFTLPDGTIVFLNANSMLTLPEGGWRDEERTVTLDGEAYFSVTKQADKRAFIVRTTDTDVRVLGTRFNVRERRGSTRIFLEEGAVRVGWKDASRPDTDLLPGELVALSSAGKQPVHQPVTSATRHTSWKSGHLLFENQPLSEVLTEISDIYGIELRLTDPILINEKLTTTGVPVDQLEVAILLLEAALDLRIEAKSEKIYNVTSTE
jgi:ferric-dicitrate binding protein FerR (iron transport regulator)